MAKKTINNAIKSSIELLKIEKESGYKDNFQSILYAVSRGVNIDIIIKYIPPYTSIVKTNKIINALILKYPQEIINAISKFDISNEQIQLILKYPQYSSTLLNGPFNSIILANMDDAFNQYRNEEEFIRYSLRKENIYVYQNIRFFTLLRQKYINMKIEQEIKNVAYDIMQKLKLNIYRYIEYEYEYELYKASYLNLTLIILNKYYLEIKHSKIDLNDILKNCKYIKKINFTINIIKEGEEEKQNISKPFNYEWKGVLDRGSSYYVFKRKINKTTEIDDIKISPEEFDDLVKYYDVTSSSTLLNIINSYKESIDYDDLDKCDYSFLYHKGLTKEQVEINKLLKEFGY